jgi:hypothetical protein
MKAIPELVQLNKNRTKIIEEYKIAKKAFLPYVKQLDLGSLKCSFTGINELDMLILNSVSDFETISNLYLTSKWLASQIEDDNYYKIVCKNFKLNSREIKNLSFNKLQELYYDKYVCLKSSHYCSPYHCVFEAASKGDEILVRHFLKIINSTSPDYNLQEITAKIAKCGNVDFLKTFVAEVQQNPRQHIYWPKIIQSSINSGSFDVFNYVYDQVYNQANMEDLSRNYDLSNCSDIIFFEYVSEKLSSSYVDYFIISKKNNWKLLEYQIKNGKCEPEKCLKILLCSNDTSYFVNFIDKYFNSNQLDNHKIYKLFLASLRICGDIKTELHGISLLKKYYNFLESNDWIASAINNGYANLLLYLNNRPDFEYDEAICKNIMHLLTEDKRYDLATIKNIYETLPYKCESEHGKYAINAARQGKLDMLEWLTNISSSIVSQSLQTITKKLVIHCKLDSFKIQTYINNLYKLCPLAFIDYNTLFLNTLTYIAKHHRTCWKQAKYSLKCMVTVISLIPDLSNLNYEALLTVSFNSHSDITTLLFRLIKNVKIDYQNLALAAALTGNCLYLQLVMVHTHKEINLNILAEKICHMHSSKALNIVLSVCDFVDYQHLAELAIKEKQLRMLKMIIKYAHNLNYKTLIKFTENLGARKYDRIIAYLKSI